MKLDLGWKYCVGTVNILNFGYVSHWLILTGKDTGLTRLVQFLPLVVSLAIFQILFDNRVIDSL